MSGKGSKLFRWVLYFILFCVLLRACGIITLTPHEHEWQVATCTEPKTCADCGKTEGEPLGHDWEDATCAAPKTCSRRGKTDGVRLDHSWADATCTEPECCSVCGKNRHWYSVPLGHDWADATCTAPKTCARCGATEGEPQHFFVSYSWDTTIEATCQNEGEASHACKLCGAAETKALPIADHKAGKWETVVEATPSADNTEKRYCEWCGIEVDSRQCRYLPLDSSGANANGNNFNAHNNENQQNTSASYVLNTVTMKFHRPSCRDVPRIAAQNYATSSQSRGDLISRGYSPCGHCNP